VRALARDRRPWIFAAAMLAAFLLTTPYSVLDSEWFLSHFLYQFRHLGGGHGLDLGIGGVYHLRRSLPLGVGWPVFLLALAGAGSALRNRWREAVVLLSFPLIFYASTFTSLTVFLRYMMPVIPFVCVFAGFGAVRIVEHVAPSKRAAALVVLVGLLAAEPLTRDVAIDRLLGRKDSRVLAAEWLVESAGAGTHSVYQTGQLWGHLELPRTATYFAATAERLRAPAITPDRQSVQDYERFQAQARYEAARAHRTSFAYVDDAGLREGIEPEYIVVLQSDLVRYSGIAPEARALVDRGYDLVHTVAGTSPGSGGWYDQLDAFYLPFTGFGGVTRPGPDVSIFRRRRVSP
jgi:hypothetical protein